jgi:excisionase family DNA binding protein
MKIPKAAIALNRSTKTIRTWIKSGILHATKLGRDWEISEEEVDRIKRDGLELKRQDE